MDILSYLTTLIKTNKEVGIPGLGTIYKRKSPGRYDIGTHSFLPPSYSLSFTSDLKEQKLLSDFISKKKNISVDAAIYFIEQFSQNILDELSGHQESDFGELGTFSTKSGSLTFTPKQDSNLGFDFYGLPSLKTSADTDKVEIAEEQIVQESKTVAEVEQPPINAEQAQVSTEPEPQDQASEQELPATELQPEVTTEQPHITEEQLQLENNNADLSDGTEDENVAIEKTENINQPVEPVVLADQPKEEVHFTLDYTETEKSGIPGYLKLIFGLIVLAVLAGIVYLAKPDLFDGLNNKPVIQQQPIIVPDTHHSVEEIEQIKADSIAHADSIRRSNEKAILAADSARDSIAAIKTTAVIPVTVEINYEIIAASLLNQKEADKFLADMKARGIPAKVANMPGRRVKITLGTFTDKETAKKELEVLKKTTRIPGIYVKEVRHTNNPK